MKVWYKSKTLWFNVIVMLLGIIPIIGTFVKLVQPGAALIIDGALAMVAGIGNLILRVWFTDTPIATSGRQAQAELEARTSYAYPQPK
jgi:hypothetical protein